MSSDNKKSQLRPLSSKEIVEFLNFVKQNPSASKLGSPGLTETALRQAREMEAIRRRVNAMMAEAKMKKHVKGRMPVRRPKNL